MQTPCSGSMIGKWGRGSKAAAPDYNDRSVSERPSVETLLATSLGPSRLLVRDFPGLGVFPGHINRVVEVQQQPFAAVEEAEAEKIVVDERGRRAQHDVDHAEADLVVLLRDNHLRAQR